MTKIKENKLLRGENSRYIQKTLCNHSASNDIIRHFQTIIPILQYIGVNNHLAIRRWISKKQVRYFCDEEYDIKLQEMFINGDFNVSSEDDEKVIEIDDWAV